MKYLAKGGRCSLRRACLLVGMSMSVGYLTPAEYARQYYDKNQGEEPLATPEDAGTLSL